MKAEIIGIIIATITAFCTAIAGAIVKHFQKKYAEPFETLLFLRKISAFMSSFSSPSEIPVL